MSWSDDKERGSLQVDGKLVFDAEGRVSDFDGRSLDLTVRRGDDVRQLLIQNARGKHTRRLYINGEERSWDDEGRKWLSEFFVGVDRRSAFAVDQRFPALYKRGGAEAVLAEVERMSGDHARGIYLGRLVEIDPLSRGTFREVMAAARRIQSDYELGRVLHALAAKADLRDESIRADFLAAADGMSSDYEKSRVLQLVLARPDLTPRLAADALRAASKMSSDYEKSRSLVTLAPSLTADYVDAYVAAVRSMHSDYERARSLLAVLDGRDLSPRVLQAMVSAVREMRSDYEVARVLVAVTQHPRANEAVRDAAQQLRSRHERRRVLAALGGRGD
jgi:hypothetical protein